jgi:hypothetical protein
MENEKWWEAVKHVPYANAHGWRIGPLPSAFRFTNLCEINMDKTGFFISTEFLGCFPMGTLRYMSFTDCRVDPDGVNFSSLTSLLTINLSRCSMGAGSGEYVFPEGMEAILLSGNNLVDPTRLKIRPIPRQQLCQLYIGLMGNSIRSMVGWIPPATCWHVNLKDNLLEELPDYVYGRNACWTDFSGNPIKNIRGLGELRVPLAFTLSNFNECPLEPVSRRMVDALQYMNKDEQKRYTLVVRQMKFLWCTEERLPGDLCRCLRSYLY